MSACGYCGVETGERWSRFCSGSCARADARDKEEARLSGLDEVKADGIEDDEASYEDYGSPLSEASHAA